MFKKTLLAATVAATFSTSALAMVVTSNEGTYEKPVTPVASKIAKQTKQTPLNVVTYSETINVQLDNTAQDLNQSEVKDRAIFAIELSGEAGMNDKGIRDFLKSADTVVVGDPGKVTGSTAAEGITFEIDGVDNNGKVQKYHVVNDTVYKVVQAAGLKLKDKADVFQDVGDKDLYVVVNADGSKVYKLVEKVEFGADATLKSYTANTIVAAVDANGDSTTVDDLNSGSNNTLGTVTDQKEAAPILSDVLKFDTEAERFEYVIDGSTLKLQLTDDIRTATAGHKLNLTFNFNEANQAFRLEEGSTAETSMTMGVLSDGSYTAGPQLVGNMFERVDLFTLDYNGGKNKDVVDATALVSKGFTQWAAAEGESATNGKLSTRSAVLQNETSAQNIQKKFVEYELVGDFSGIAMEDGALAGNSDWKLNEDKTALTFAYPSNDTDNITGFVGQDGNGSKKNPAASSQDVISSLDFSVLADNAKQIPAQSFTLNATVVDNPTFTEYSLPLANIFNVKRDGLRFDTVTTGTTSANVIYIRDIDGITADAGKVYVTITEYDEHGAQQNGEGSILTTDANGNPGPAELSVTLPKNGALTLTPAGVAEMVGAEINPTRQARFVFDVETNMGEAAVKKNTSDGVDIQTGSQPQNKEQLDFTL